MHIHRALVGAVTIAALTLVAMPVSAADESDLAGRAAAWQEGYNSGNLEAIAALYAEDASRMPPNAETIGKDGIVANLQSFKDAGAATVHLTVTDAESVGDLAYGAGTYELLGADGSHIDHGKWLNVSKRINGEWKIYSDIWNSNMALPTP
ncbi:MAG: YybH family protein [Vicinamibacteria bacterium]